MVRKILAFACVLAMAATLTSTASAGLLRGKYTRTTTTTPAVCSPAACAAVASIGKTTPTATTITVPVVYEIRHIGFAHRVGHRIAGLFRHHRHHRAERKERKQG